MPTFTPTLTAENKNGNNDALIGYSGFVGGTLLRQRAFAHQYRSTTVEQLAGKDFDLVVGAGAPAQKWIANKDPDADAAKIDQLIDHLKSINSCKEFVLISTVDVFKNPNGVTESTEVDTTDHHAYGSNRRRLEQFVEDHFKNHLIVRLPGLVGPGLKKNVIYDFLYNNNVDQIDSRGVFQFYPMVNLWADITTARQASLKLVHLTAEPISVAEIAEDGFGFTFNQPKDGPAARYDFYTEHAKVFGATGNYLYNKRESLQAIRSYAQATQLSEQRLQSATSISQAA